MTLSSEDATGWLQAIPLEYYSSLHEITWKGLIGIPLPWTKNVLVEFNFNLHNPLILRPDTYLTLHTCDATQIPIANPSFSITRLQRWRIDISPFTTFDTYIRSLRRWHRCVYTKGEETFNNYGCTLKRFHTDWSEHTETVYHLYRNVAAKHGYKMYDLHFFQEAAKRRDYHLFTAWYNEKMIGMSLLREEPPTLHATCCGLDYEHSSKSYTYSSLYYDVIRFATETGKFNDVDAGLTADDFKKMIGFQPIPSRLDIYSNGIITRNILKLASYIVSATVTAESKVKISLRRRAAEATEAVGGPCPHTPRKRGCSPFESP